MTTNQNKIVEIYVHVNVYIHTWICGGRRRCRNTLPQRACHLEVLVVLSPLGAGPGQDAETPCPSVTVISVPRTNWRLCVCICAKRPTKAHCDPPSACPLPPPTPSSSPSSDVWPASLPLSAPYAHGSNRNVLRYTAIFCSSFYARAEQRWVCYFIFGFSLYSVFRYTHTYIFFKVYQCITPSPLRFARQKYCEN